MRGTRPWALEVFGLRCTDCGSLRGGWRADDRLAFLAKLDGPPLPGAEVASVAWYAEGTPIAGELAPTIRRRRPAVAAATVVALPALWRKKSRRSAVASAFRGGSWRGWCGRC